MRALKLAFPYILAAAWMATTAFALVQFADFAKSTERYRASRPRHAVTAPAGRDAPPARPLRVAR